MAVVLNGFQKGLDPKILYAKGGKGVRRTGDDGRDSLRVMCWNIERGYEPEMLAGCINELDPDVVCLQEVDWGNARTGNVDVLDYLANKTGMQGLFGIEFFELESPDRGAELAGGGVHGNAILSRRDFARAYRIELPALFDWTRPKPGEEKASQPRLGGRFALCAEVECGGSRVTFCSAHLENIGGDVEGRVRQLESMLLQLDAAATDTLRVVTGDFNTLGSWLTQLAHITQSPRNKPWYRSECSWWQRSVLPRLGYVDTSDCREWTFEAYGFYRVKLDWILVNQPGRVLRHGVGEFRSSDHRPIWVEMRIRDEKGDRERGSRGESVQSVPEIS